MKKTYLFRMDDITPGMKSRMFWKFIDMFKDQSVVPLLGVVPDNKDPNLIQDDLGGTFWKDMKQLQDDGIAEFAQHGFDHVYIRLSTGILGKYVPLLKQSEFADVDYETQNKKIKDGRSILQSNGIFTNTWIAPGHTFDMNTINCLHEHCFTHISDGIGLYPYKFGGLTFIPQQFWIPKHIWFGNATICIHSNEVDDAYLDFVYRFIKEERAYITALSRIANMKIRMFFPIVNKLWNNYYIARYRF